MALFADSSNKKSPQNPTARENSKYGVGSKEQPILIHSRRRQNRPESPDLTHGSVEQQLPTHALCVGSTTQHGPVKFFGLGDMRQSSSGFLTEHIEISFPSEFDLTGVRIVRDPPRHDFVNSYTFDLSHGNGVTYMETNSNYERYKINLNAALTKNQKQHKYETKSSQHRSENISPRSSEISSFQPVPNKKRTRPLSLSQEKTIFRLSHSARVVGTSYRIVVKMKMKKYYKSSEYCKTEFTSGIFRVFGSNSSVGRLTLLDSLDSMSDNQRREKIRKVTLEAVDELLPEIVSSVRFHVLQQQRELRRARETRQMDLLLAENQRLKKIITTQLRYNNVDVDQFI